MFRNFFEKTILLLVFFIALFMFFFSGAEKARAVNTPQVDCVSSVYASDCSSTTPWITVGNQNPAIYVMGHKLRQDSIVHFVDNPYPPSIDYQFAVTNFITDHLVKANILLGPPSGVPAGVYYIIVENPNEPPQQGFSQDEVFFTIYNAPPSLTLTFFPPTDCPVIGNYNLSYFRVDYNDADGDGMQLLWFKVYAVSDSSLAVSRIVSFEPPQSPPYTYTEGVRMDFQDTCSQDPGDINCSLAYGTSYRWEALITSLPSVGAPCFNEHTQTDCAAVEESGGEFNVTQIPGPYPDFEILKVGPGDSIVGPSVTFMYTGSTTCYDPNGEAPCLNHFWNFDDGETELIFPAPTSAYIRIHEYEDAAIQERRLSPDPFFHVTLSVTDLNDLTCSNTKLINANNLSEAAQTATPFEREISSFDFDYDLCSSGDFSGGACSDIMAKELPPLPPPE